MSASVNDTPEPESAEEPVTLSEGLGVCGLILLLGLVSFISFICFSDLSWGTQLTTVISYSGAVFIWTFFRTRGVRTKHDLWAPYVRQQMPRLLLDHLAFVVVILVVETWALGLRPSLSSWWLTAKGPKDMPPFDSALSFTIVAIGIGEVVLLRRILGRAKKDSLERSPA